MALRKIVSIGTVAVVIFISTPALAENTRDNNNERGSTPRGMMIGNMREKLPPMMRPAVLGSVSAISGTTITLNGRITPGNNATSTYSIDASNAKVLKSGATTTLSSIAVGDMIFVEGSISGTNITAKLIRDGVRGVGFGPEKRNDHASSTPAFTGNGQPLVAGKISAVSGNTLTVTTGNNVVYTVDATNAKILRGRNPISLSDVATGDGVLVQGAVNGNAITASTIIEKPQPPAEASDQSEQAQEPHHGIFENVGGFFKHLFGF